MAPGSITSWQIGGEKVETVADSIFLDSKITVHSDCRHEVKRYLLPGGKAMTKLDDLLKTGNITLLTIVHLVKAMVFSVVVYRCESGTIKKADCQETMLLSCSAGEDSWESLGEQGEKNSAS